MMLSLRSRLVLGIVLTLGAASLATILVGAWTFHSGVTEQALTKTQHDLASARVIYDAAMQEIGQEVRIAACDPAVVGAMQRREQDGVPERLERLRGRDGLDVLDLLDEKGHVLARAVNPSVRGDDLSGDAAVARILAGAPWVVTNEVAGEEALRRESDQLAARARIDAASGLGPATDVRDGLVIKAAAAVVAEDGKPLGVLYGWKLLNHDTTIVDRIKRTIYQGETYRGREIGEGTLCLGDVRVATNAVRERQRAVGSRVDPVVSQRVLIDGKERIDRANVLGETHLTAYEPLRDLQGKVIGILCLGIPEARYTELGRRALSVYLAVSIGAVLLGFAVSGVIARGITRPIRRLVATADSLAQGDLDKRWQCDGGVAEIEVLGARFNQMADAIRHRDQELRRLTQQQIGRAERLAMIGRLAAGVAHEINNPLGGIMLFSNLLLRKAPTEGLQRENLQRIADEAKRCQRIVQGLLDFARHRAPHVGAVDLRAAIDKTLELVRQQPLFMNVALRVDYGECPSVLADTAQVQQVFINVIVNAAEAMDGNGSLTIVTESVDGGKAVQVSFRDTGRGMTAEQLERLFEPFFTTKEVGHGTGLGLSISRGIVENHGGMIWAESEPGKGTAMFVKLPSAETV